MQIETYANPHRFMQIARRIHILFWVAAVIFLGAGIYNILASPPDYQQGEYVKILFIHVPAAWMALFIYSFIFIASLSGLILRHPLSFLAARIAAPFGAGFCLILLSSGALWGQPIWGVWWVWDARLTSALVLLFIYLGYIALWQVIEDEGRAARATAVLAIVGFINIPIIKFSVDWWNTLHQPASISRLSAPALHSDFVAPLLFVAAGFLFLFIALLLTAMQTHIYQQRLMRKNNV